MCIAGHYSRSTDAIFATERTLRHYQRVFKLVEVAGEDTAAVVIETAKHKLYIIYTCFSDMYHYTVAVSEKTSWVDEKRWR